MAKTKQKSEHYVNNKDFSEAVHNYAVEAHAAKARDEKAPMIPNYIAESFLKIAEGLSHKANFVRYTYREEMVMDGVENCLKAIENYDPAVVTRTGRPNAFAYFTQIIWYAFLRRIAKEKKQQDIKMRYMAQSGYEEFIQSDDNDEGQEHMKMFVDVLHDRISNVRKIDERIKEVSKAERQKRTVKSTDSDLSEFFDE